MWATVIQLAAEGLGGLAVLLILGIAWLGRYHIRRLDKLDASVSAIRETYITRQELIATLTRSEAVITERHKQSMERLERIEQKIEKNADEAKQDRHELRNMVTPVAIDVARLAGKADASTEIAQAIQALASKGG